MSGCDNCGGAELPLVPVCLCEACYVLNREKLAAVKLRLSGDVNWEDVQQHGIYDRFGVPIATVVSVITQAAPTVYSAAYQMQSTGRMAASTGQFGQGDTGVKQLTVKELKR